MNKYSYTLISLFTILYLGMGCNSAPPSPTSADSTATDTAKNISNTQKVDEGIPLVGLWERTFKDPNSPEGQPDSITFTIHLNALEKKAFREIGEECYGWMDFTSSPAHTYYYEIDTIEYLGNQQYALLHPNWMGTDMSRDTVIFNPQTKELIYNGTLRENWAFKFIPDNKPFRGNWVRSEHEELSFCLRNVTLSLYEKYKSQEQFYFQDKDCYGHFIFNDDNQFVTGLITDVLFVDYNFARIKWINTQDSIPEAHHSYLYYNRDHHSLNFDHEYNLPKISERIE